MDYLVDYAQSLEDCFTQVARFLLPVLGLKILTAVRHPHNMDMPSWIPDWSQNLPLSYEHFDYELEPCFNEREHTIRSSGTGHASKPRLELHVTGCQYARIVERSQIVQFSDLADAQRQMKGLYFSLENLRQFTFAEDVCMDATVSNTLGQAILEGKY
jgi:hypothetical protein